eukprot:TRINITY_DN10088_c0_g1_i1.p1 TRINITY_DN10088_c0_g1~~TRINITY_DN10088_c0_g1_i1.p1  ORF type:complete len:358 (+),score=68.52 TRINITY_DN10088_c0_g1_i1:106-1179(+)
MYNQVGESVFTLETIGLHCAGEPARVVVKGIPTVPGETMFQKREYFMEHYDHIRKLLLQEPRGYPCQNANIIFPASSPESAFGFIILEQNKIYPLMSGHNTICVATALLETGMLPMVEPVSEFVLEAPGGFIPIRAEVKDKKVLSVEITNVPSFVAHVGVQVDVTELGKICVDVAFGGMWYAIVEANAVGLEIIPKNGKQLARFGEMIKVAAREQFPVKHPCFDYPGVDILVFTEPSKDPLNSDGKNTVVMSNNQLNWDDPSSWTGMLDRSPCGTGTCAVMASLWKKQKLKIGTPFVHESIIGTKFQGKLISETSVGPYEAVVPVIKGQAWITEYSWIVLHPSDPFLEGYTVGDIWA